jgi:hypothetical protein
MFGLVAQYVSGGTANTENALTSISDPDITSQNSQFIFTGPYNLLQDLAVGASVKFGRYNVAQWNGRGRYNIYAVNRNANPTAPIFWGGYKRHPIPMPQNQQIQALLTNNLASGTENEYLAWRISTPDWNMNVPGNLWTFVAQATVTVTPVVGSWVESQAITFDQLPLGGVYAVIGAQCEGANGMFWRLNFPRSRMYLGRKLRPGGVVLGAFGALPPLFSASEFEDLGVWGFFHTFELPTFGILGTSASSTTYTLMLKLAFLGESVSLLDQALQSNY